MKLQCIKAANGLEVGKYYDKWLPETDEWIDEWNAMIHTVAVTDDYGDVRFHKKDCFVVIEAAMCRMKAMLEAAKSGTYIAPNRINGIPKQDFSKLPDDITVYAHIPNNEVNK